jgi:carbon storage regulator CsrA
MLVLSRKTQQSLVVGGSGAFGQVLKVTVVEIKNGRVRLGFETDAAVSVLRSEVWERIRASGQPEGSGKDDPKAAAAQLAHD